MRFTAYVRLRPEGEPELHAGEDPGEGPLGDGEDGERLPDGFLELLRLAGEPLRVD